MPHLLWTTDMSIGVEALDADHRALLGLVRRLDESVRAEEPFDVVASLLTVAVELTRAHSEREERVAAALGRPVGAEHHHAHSAFVTWLDGVSNDFDRDRDRDRVRAVMPVIVDWWRHHMMDLDMADKALFIENAAMIEDLLNGSVLAEPILENGPLGWPSRLPLVLGLAVD